MRYNDVYTFIQAGLTAKGYGTPGNPAMPTFHPGPSTIHQLWNKSPNSMVFLTVGNGAGLAKEGVFERPFIVARVIGPQMDFTAAETLAYDVDGILLAVDTNTQVGTALTLYITRTAGSPQLVDFDAANRYHFQTTYIAEAQRV